MTKEDEGSRGFLRHCCVSFILCGFLVIICLSVSPIRDARFLVFPPPFITLHARSVPVIRAHSWLANVRPLISICVSLRRGAPREARRIEVRTSEKKQPKIEVERPVAQYEGGREREGEREGGRERERGRPGERGREGGTEGERVISSLSLSPQTWLPLG